MPSNAPYCPKCKAGKGLSPAVMMGGLVLGLALVTGIVKSLTGDSHEAAPPAAATTPVRPRPVFTPPPPPAVPTPVRSAVLAAAYKENEIAADREWKGKRVRIVGAVREIRKSLGTPVVIVRGAGFMNDVHCRFPDDTSAALEQIKKGGNIILDGTVDGELMGSVMLKGCEWPAHEDVERETPEAVKWWKR